MNEIFINEGSGWMCHYCENMEECVEPQTVNGQDSRMTVWTFIVTTCRLLLPTFMTIILTIYQEFHLFLISFQSVLGRKYNETLWCLVGKQPLLNLCAYL